MSGEWMPIETAPADVRVMVGSWDVWAGKMKWIEDTGVVFERKFFGLFKTKNYIGHRYSYWRPLPSPPVSQPNHTEA